MSFFSSSSSPPPMSCRAAKQQSLTVAVVLVSFSCFGLLRVRRGRRVLLLAVAAAAAAKEALSSGGDKGEEPLGWRGKSVVGVISILRRSVCRRGAHLHGVVGGHGPEPTAVRAAHFISREMGGVSGATRKGRREKKLCSMVEEEEKAEVPLLSLSLAKNSFFTRLVAFFSLIPPLTDYSESERSAQLDAPP